MEMVKNPPASENMDRLAECISVAQSSFRDILNSYLNERSTTIEQYIRYLSFQYHLTKGVQKYFFAIAAHSDLRKKRSLRDFLCNFAREEELHYLVAANDLLSFGQKPLPIPIDVELWHSYFTEVVRERPFVRLGAATILENISGGVARNSVKRALSGSFLNKGNTKFLVLHQHEALPHGDQILEAIESAELDDRQFSDLIEGAKKGTVLYMRMAEWAIRPTCLASICDGRQVVASEDEDERIRSFDMRDLEVV